MESLVQGLTYEWFFQFQCFGPPSIYFCIFHVVMMVEGFTPLLGTVICRKQGFFALYTLALTSL